MSRRAARTDDNQKEIIKALRDIPGVSVEPGHDDILVGYRNNTYWVELKNPNAVSKKTGAVLDSRKQKSQHRLSKEWTGHYFIAWTLDQILNEIGVTHG